jgi:hypothetical protein
MTTWLDYSSNPPENNTPPPVGAPENMPTSQVNNVMREIMSVIRLMGDEFQGNFDGLGTMAAQNADAVAITGGTVTATLAGPGAGITNLKAQNLIEGPIPAAIFPADATPLDAKVARAGVADNLTSTLSVLPIGTILLWYSANPVPTGWQLCDGTNGTPDLRGRMVLGAGPSNGLGSTGGAWQSTVATDAQGAHSHGGGTGGYALGINDIPSHTHFEVAGAGAGGGATGPQRTLDANTTSQGNMQTSAVGGGAAHAHAIGADGNHVHNVTVNTMPVYTAVYYIMRVS